MTSRQFSDGTTPVRFDLAYTATNLVGTLTRYSDLAGSTKVGESDYGYSANQQVTNILHKNGSGTTLINLTYTYDQAERVATQQGNGTTQTYTYDHTGQLTGDGLTSYSFDGAGNRTMTGYSTGTANRLTTDGTWTYSYDTEGNVVKKSRGANAETWTYGYDNKNEMTSAVDRSCPSGGSRS